MTMIVKAWHWKKSIVFIISENDENPEQSDEEQEEDSGDNYEEIEADLELDIPGSGGVINLDHELDMEVHLLWRCWHKLTSVWRGLMLI